MTNSIPIISAADIGKSFARNPRKNVSRGVGDILCNICCMPLTFDRDDQEFWAVENVSLDIYPGDAIGIIGRNGGGKTTLMKLLAGLLTPSRGSVQINGEIQALINLGAGFNQRLSGRENVINGIALRGFNANKYPDLFEQIIDFSEIGPFIDSPVETYSSGMKSRLGFALCAFLEPDLIVIDEALSVGDIAFQNKCRMQLQSMKQKGVAMLLVSHSMTNIKQFCDRAIWLKDGKVHADGTAEDITADYMLFMDEQSTNIAPIRQAQIEKSTRKPVNKSDKWHVSSAPAIYTNTQDKPDLKNEGDTSFLANNRNFSWERPAISEHIVAECYGGFVEMSDISDFSAVLLTDETPTDSVQVNQPFTIEYSFHLDRQVRDLNVSLVFHTIDGERLATISTLNGNLLKKTTNGRVLCGVLIDDLCFAPGEYIATISIHEGSAYLWRDAILSLKISPQRYMVWNKISLSYEYRVFEITVGTKKIEQ